MKKLIYILVVFCFLSHTHAQISDKYDTLRDQAWSFYESKQYEESGQKYDEAFATNDGKGLVRDKYNAACSWALAGNVERAFFHLDRIANKGNYQNYAHITSDPDLSSLHDDVRWQPLIDKVLANKEEAEKHLDKALVAQLDTIYNDDQNLRRQIGEINDKYGWESQEMKDHWKEIRRRDSLNLIKVKAIIDEHGWLGSDVVGRNGNQTLFLVIQHSDPETWKEYLPIMRQAVEDKKASPSSLALLEDRTALSQGQLQIYGSQIGTNPETREKYVLPLLDPANVNERRLSVGLGSIESYIKRWDLEWNVEEYLQRLPEYKQLNGM